MPNHSIHHVTAVTAHIGQNLQFYTGVLGLRLVKKSVNQDDVSAYHLFYADAVGTPGTDMTFFDWPSAGSNLPGPGTVALTVFRVPQGSLDFWHDRLEAASAFPHLGEGHLLFNDPEGQRLELVEDKRSSDAVPWTSEVPEEKAIRGILGVDIESARPESTAKVLTDILGYKRLSSGYFETDDEAARVRLVVSGANRLGRVGAGGVHHVAFRVKDDEELLAMQAKVEAAGISTSGYIDRFYFHSLYFREPGGILFELATEGPGFASDESMEELGKHLALPPFLENRRDEIESGLKPLPT
ncbi:ring-cleaving dioxygenase [Fimbriimonas ginsengisoli]|uniref:Glyoxalase/bleomycin resistance protein/dioxygenase n=1 Tax=Fimbriimonas ginsengisoli Gsoil 348 TaxID=661478 RepID=A0A068NW08_FIMGI|nr:ring-cleaving dioxygenase [Fimbriimonas ginsengisoli]AIE85794.1 glyoxalase/bleomycin resistance protein/dioxygenase [Fimbriimonas ginsengisoli Gsoil 348]